MLSTERVNGIRKVLNSTAPNPEAESEGIRADLIAELWGTSASFAALPTSGNWPGRSRWLADEKRYADFDGTAWQRRPLPGFPRLVGHYSESTAVALSSGASGQRSGSFTLARPGRVLVTAHFGWIAGANSAVNYGRYVDGQQDTNLGELHNRGRANVAVFAMASYEVDLSAGAHQLGVRLAVQSGGVGGDWISTQIAVQQMDAR